MALPWTMTRALRCQYPGAVYHLNAATPDPQFLRLDFIMSAARMAQANHAMKKKNNTSATPAALTKSLNQVLADSYALMALTHQAHWNVEGPGFFALHTAFQTQYEELFIAIDEIAERIRALGDYAIGGLGTFAEVARIKEYAPQQAQEAYVKAVLEANQKLVTDAGKARDLAEEVNDLETQDLMIGRITVHQKTIWMLGSFLK